MNNLTKYIKKNLLIIVALVLFICVGNLNTFSADVQAKSNSIVIEDASEATVKKLDKSLKKGKSLMLKVKGSEKSADKMINTIRNRIKNVNGAGAVFQYTKGNKSGAYCTYNISTDDAKMYCYTIKFINKLYKKTIERIKSREGFEMALADRAAYPDNEELYLRVVYDNAIRNIHNMYVDYKWVYDDILGQSVKVDVQSVIGAEAPTTISDMEYMSFKSQEFCEKSVVVREWTEDDVMMCQVKSFEEFKNTVDIDKLKKLINVESISDQEMLIINSRFCDLSDAMKVYAIDTSRYFACRFKRGKEYGMLYSYDKAVYGQGYKAMKILLNNKAVGVCSTFAYYEMVLFKQLGIDVYSCSSYYINHGWTVVKVKNSEGKTLWVPFDYGIGPAENLAVTKEQKKYINTEKKRYKLYLQGIKGAPKKKNFTDTDFN